MRLKKLGKTILSTSPSDLTPFTYLCSLEQKVALHAKETLYPTGEPKEWIGVSFLSGNYLLFAPLKELAAIIPLASLTSIPGVKPWLRGLTAYRGEVFPVSDLSGFLVQKMTKITLASRIFMINIQDGYAGLLIDRVLSLQRITIENKKEESVIGLMPEYEPFMDGSIKMSCSQLPIISCKAIVQHPRFRDVVLREETKGIRE